MHKVALRNKGLDKQISEATEKAKLSSKGVCVTKRAQGVGDADTTLSEAQNAEKNTKAHVACMQS